MNSELTPDRDSGLDLISQLQAHKPTAPAELRREIRALAARQEAPGLASRLGGFAAQTRAGWRRSLLVAVPVACVLALAVAAATTLNRSSSHDLSASGGANGSLSGENIPQTPSATDSATRIQGQSAKGALAPAPTPNQNGRPQKIDSFLTLELRDVAALSGATLKAYAVVQHLGGYAQSVDYKSGREHLPQVCPLAEDTSGVKQAYPYCQPAPDDRAAVAVLTLKLPAARAQEAMLKLASLGTITGQSLQVADLEQSNNQLAAQLARARGQVAELKRELARSLSVGERVTLRSQLDQARQELRSLEDQLTQNALDARYATLTLTMQTPKIKHPGPAHHGQAHRVLAKSVSILAWEAVAVVYALVVSGPLLSLGFVLWRLERRRRRRADERLLEDA